MAILSMESLLRAEEQRLLAVEGRKEFNAFSLDLRLGTLYRRREIAASMNDEKTLSQEEFIRQVLDEVPLGNEGIIITPQDFYLWQPREKIFLAKGLIGEITSRSSWARLGVRVESKQSDDYLFNRPLEDVHVQPLCTLKTMGTSVRIKPGDSFGQLFVMDFPEYLHRDESLAQLMVAGELVIQRGKKVLASTEVRFDQGLALTMDSNIHIYTGSVLEPGNLKPTDFEEVTLRYLEDLFLPQGAFFLSSSSEHVEIPKAYAGYVIERDPSMFLSPFSTHAHAPYIGPRTVFKGKITFENRMCRNGYVQCGMPQSKLLLCPLAPPIEQAQESRYMGQKATTRSRL